MTAIIRPNLHHTMAESIYEKIQNKSAVYYYYLGKTLTWDDEAEPPLPENNNSYEMDARNNIITLKQISLNDVAFITRRVDWASGTVFDMYDDTYLNSDPLEQRNFYVLTENFNVYKCISNNSGAQSTVEPSGTDVDYFSTADGYVWKFMFFLPLALRNKFMTASLMPVPKQVKNKYYSAGVIEDYTIVHAGNSYDVDEAYPVVAGNGTGADIDITVEDGTITAITINNGGTGYTNPQLTIMPGNSLEGEGADINLILSSPGDLETLQANVELLTAPRDVSYILVQSSSQGYTAAPAVTITGDGTGAVATSVIDSNGQVTDIVLTSRGQNYSYANVSIAAEDLGGGVSATASARAIISPIGGHGSNAPRELHADTLSFYAAFEDETNQGVTISNDYRQFGIIKDIDKFEEIERYNSALGSGCFLLEGTLTGVNYSNDSDIHTSGNAKTLRVVVAEDNKILAQSVDGSLPVVGDTFYNSDDSNNFTITTITNPDVNKFTGEVLFIDNRSAFTPSDEQIVVFRTFIRF
jgi:hypothetical protein